MNLYAFSLLNSKSIIQMELKGLGPRRTKGIKEQLKGSAEDEMVGCYY